MTPPANTPECGPSRLTGFIDRWAARAGFSRARIVTLCKFMAVGLPAFLLAVPLNYLLVERAHFAKPLAYALVMALQVSINFFMCRAFVFERSDRRSLWVEFGSFFGGIMLFRLADWVVYVFLVNVVGLYYLAVQLVNVAVFALLKFLFSEWVFLRKDRPSKGGS